MTYVTLIHRKNPTNTKPAQKIILHYVMHKMSTSMLNRSHRIFIYLHMLLVSSGVSRRRYMIDIFRPCIARLSVVLSVRTLFVHTSSGSCQPLTRYMLILVRSFKSSIRTTVMRMLLKHHWNHSLNHKNTKPVHFNSSCLNVKTQKFCLMIINDQTQTRINYSWRFAPSRSGLKLKIFKENMFWHDSIMLGYKIKYAT